MTERPPEWLADLLADPDDGSIAGLDHAGNCVTRDRRVAPNRGGILRFVPDEGYTSNFGKEWRWFARTQLDAPDRGATESEQAFFTKTGWSPGDFRDATVLDAGCGMGRFAEVAARHGARVVAVDLSEAVVSAHRNLASTGRVAVIQADIRRLPLRPDSFDLIYSLGVLHHTPDPRSSFAGLIPLLRPGGKIAIWVYSGEPEARSAHRLSDLYRRCTTRMDPDRLLRLCRLVEPLGRLYRTRLGERLYRLLPVSTHPRREWRVLDTFDWYSPRYQWKHRWHEVETWFRELGLAEISRGGQEVAVSGRRPACPPNRSCDRAGAAPGGGIT